MIFGRAVRLSGAFLLSSALLGAVPAVGFPDGSRRCEVVVEGRGAVRRFSVPTCTFALSWIHSVERTEWRETYVVDRDGEIVLSASEFSSGGAGLPDAVGEGETFRRENGAMRIERRNVRIGELRIRLSDVSHHRLGVGGDWIDLNAEFGDGVVTIRGAP